MPPKADKALLSANLRANLAALKNPDSPDGEGVAAWLESAQSSERIEVLEAKDGSLVLSIGGAIQDSLVAPAKEAGKIFERGLVAGRGEIWLFGLGGPALLKAALSKAGKLTVFEPDPQVARAALSAIDASFELSSGKLSIVSPERLSSGIPRPISASILAHPSSVRRAPRFSPASRGFSREAGLSRPVPTESP